MAQPKALDGGYLGQELCETSYTDLTKFISHGILGLYGAGISLFKKKDLIFLKNFHKNIVDRLRFLC